MGKKDFLNDLDEITAGADLASEKKKAANPKESGFKMKSMRIPNGWDDKIKEFTGSPAAGYMLAAIREKMTRDGLL